MSRRKTPFRPLPSRRGFLRGLGFTAAATGLLPLLESDAQGGGKFPKRLILVHTPDGANTGDWRPSGGESDFTLSTILSPLQDVRDQIVICDGLRGSMVGAGEAHAYGMAGLWTGARSLEGNLFDGGNGNLTGWGEGISVDQIVADVFEKETPFRSLEFGVQSGDPNIVSRMIYSAPEAPVSPEKNPYTMFDKLFGEIGINEAELAQLRARKRSVLDAVGGQLSTLENKVAAHDKQKIEAHLAAVRAIEGRLDNSIGTCEVPMIGEELDVDDNANFPAIGDLQMRLMTTALACDVTRVASLQWSRGFSNVRHEWIGKDGGHHGYSHGGGVENNTDIDRWYAERLRDLILLLQSYPEGDGTLLDNTLIVWGRELGNPGHGMHPIPLVLAGGAGGAMATGRYLDFGDTRHAALLVSICQAMGLTDVNSVGTINPNSGPLPGLLG